MADTRRKPRCTNYKWTNSNKWTGEKECDYCSAELKLKNKASSP